MNPVAPRSVTPLFKTERSAGENPAAQSAVSEGHSRLLHSHQSGGLPIGRQAWSDKDPEGRWRSFNYEELVKRDKVNLDIFWLKDESLEDSEDLPDPDVLTQEIVADLQTALEQFSAVAEGVKG